MRKIIMLLMVAIVTVSSCKKSNGSPTTVDPPIDPSASKDWKGIEVPADAGAGKRWVLQEDLSDDFNYEAPEDNKGAEFAKRWNDYFHNNWTGPAPTIWRRDHSRVAGGYLQLRSGRPIGSPNTNTACLSSVKKLLYPVYIEGSMKVTKSVLANAFWLLSPDDTQEIDMLEAYGGERWTNPYFSDMRIHLSHHVFTRNPMQDWQPGDAGSFYTDGTTVWNQGYHRFGVYWKDPWNLKYYIDGKLVRSRSGVSEIDPLNYTNGTGLNKEMDIIISMADQTWRAAQGLSPTDAELAVTENNTFKLNWVRVYKPI